MLISTSVFGLMLIVPLRSGSPPLPLGAITIDNAFVPLPVALVALTVKLDVPAVVGVPAITPAVESVNPSGNDPVSMLHVIGVSPVAVSVWLYAVPTVPLGNDAVVTVGAVPVVPPLPSSQAIKENPITATMAAKPNSFTLFFIKCSSNVKIDPTKRVVLLNYIHMGIKCKELNMPQWNIEG